LMVCKSCKIKLSNTDVYCGSCGVPTESFRKQFNVKSVLSESRAAMKAEKNKNATYSLFVSLLLLMSIYITTFQVITESYWINYLLTNVLCVLIIPFLLLSFNVVKHENIIFNVIKYYPKMLLLVSLVAFYFFVLKVVCQGDPILNLVRLVMVLWGLAIVFPSVCLIFNNGASVITSIKQSYIAGKYLRWQQFAFVTILGILLYMTVVFANIFFYGVPIEALLSGQVMFFILLLMACLPLILIPKVLCFASFVMQSWYKRQEEFKLYDRNKNY